MAGSMCRKPLKTRLPELVKSVRLTWPVTPLLSHSAVTALPAAAKDTGAVVTSSPSGSGRQFASFMESFSAREQDFSLPVSSSGEQPGLLSPALLSPGLLLKDKPETLFRSFSQALFKGLPDIKEEATVSDAKAEPAQRTSRDPEDEPVSATSQAYDYAVEVPLAIVVPASKQLPVQFSLPVSPNTENLHFEETTPRPAGEAQPLTRDGMKPQFRVVAPGPARLPSEIQTAPEQPGNVPQQMIFKAPEKPETFSTPVLPDVTPTYAPSKAPLALQVHLVPVPSQKQPTTHALVADQKPVASSASAITAFEPSRNLQTNLSPRAAAAEAEPSDSPASPAELTPSAISKSEPKSPSHEHADSEDSERQSWAPATTKRAQPPIEPAEAAVKQPATNPVSIAAPHAPQNSKQAPVSEKQEAAASQFADIPEATPQRTEPVRDIGFRMASPHSGPVDIKVIERAGQIRVAVHSADPAITKSLQDNVGELTGKLERSSFQTETFTPGSTQTPQPAAHANNLFQESPRDRKAPQYEQPRSRKTRTSNTEFKIETFTESNQENS